ncbi:MBOAT family protein [Gammaproteobacteria bacterium]|nr:MBOAT family protein [Gammaproteobacteria bacterium]
MLFNSLEFLFYLPIVFILYWFVFGKYSLLESLFGRAWNTLKIQNLFIVFASYLFYGWWDWRFLLLIFFTSVCSFVSGLFIHKWQGSTKAKILSASNIILNLVILGFFKYYNFFIDSFVDIMTAFGLQAHVWSLHIILPVGISFYTFQALSYSIDVYRKKIEPTHDIVAFLAYVSFFPQLVAGPIERATQLLPQFQKERHFDYDMAVDGLRQMLWGFFKKVVIADSCALYVNTVWADYTSHNTYTLILAILLFSVQIYGDFSGYSDIAIGTAKLFGIQLMRNFHVPYFARDIGEFWRRWHISLTTWFKDYLYIPLGGSRGGKWLTIRNTFIIFLVSGFWHGANWTFVIWGLFHALLFMPALLMQRNRRYVNHSVAQGHFFPTIKETLQMLLTFAFVTFAWIFFRAPSVYDASQFIVQLTHWGHLNEMIETFRESGNTFYLGPKIILLIVIEWLLRDKQHGLALPKTLPQIIKLPLYVVLIYFILFNHGQAVDFIYFQF